MNKALLESSFSVHPMQVSLQLDVEGKKSDIFASHIEEMNFNFHPYGFEAFVQFTTYDEDEISTLFAEEKVMKATLIFKSTDPKKAGAELLQVKGIVGERSYAPLGKEAKKNVRLFTIRFTDAAQMSWSHHFPIKIYVDQTMKEVIDAEKNPLITIKYDLEALNEASPILALPISNKVSFYSFLTWYLQKSNGILDYNYKDHTYSILGKKKEDGKPVTLSESMISPALCKYSEPSRHVKRMVKHSPDNVDHTDEDNPNGFSAVRNDNFDDSTYLHHPEQINQAIQSKLSPQKNSINFFLKEFADAFTIEQLVPGTLIEIKGLEVGGGHWSDEPAYKGKIFRLTDISFKFFHTTPTGLDKKPIREYQFQIQVFAESKDETYIPRPAFQQPTYPYSIPGKIFSPGGDKEQTTHNLVKNDKTPLGHYLVKVPIVGGDKKIVVPFFPDFTSGQSFAPLCKDQQVMLSMYFQTAKIERVLDWQPLARLPLETQANQFVFASNGKDKYFIQKHEFKNGKDSIYSLKQSSSAEQTQMMQIQEKDILVIVDEKGKYIASFQANRDSGLTLLVKDEASGVTNQIVLKPPAITVSSEGSDGKSTLVIKPDSIAGESKTITLKCDDGIFEASKTFTVKGGSKIFIEAPVVNIKDKAKIG